MPGITGIISKSSNGNCEKKLELMIDSMLHESFYNSGKYINDKIGIYAGWVCHQGSFSDCMPVWNEKKTAVLLLFGDNYTDLDLFDTLKAKHHTFDNSNASYIIHLYEEKGIDFLQDLNGWFSGILIDIQAEKVFLFNDRYGMQRIFYYAGKDSFYFSSEAKALLKVCPELRELDIKSFGEFLSCDCVLENRTLFKNVFLLPGGSVWIFRHKDSVKKTFYFKADALEDQPWLEKEYFLNELKETFKKILPRYFRTNQKIGISLTGGLDTRAILANFQMPEGKYPCYTFGGMYRDCYDVKVAREVAETCHQTHQTLYLDDKFLSDFSKYAEKTVYISDGYFSVSGSYEIYLNSLAREIAPIRMTGNYGGEILRAIEGKLKATPPDNKSYHPDINMHFQEAANTVDKLYKASSHPLTFNLCNEIPWFRNLGFTCEQSQLTPRTPYLDNDLVSLMYRAPPEVRNDMALTLRLIADNNPELGAILSDRGFGGGMKFPMSTFIEKYLDFFFKAEYAYNYGMPQWLAQLDSFVMPMHLEKLFLGRHKFAHFRIWYRDELADYIKSILLDGKSLGRSYINSKKVEEMVQSHTKGNRNFTTEISKLLSLELIHRIFLDSDL